MGWKRTSGKQLNEVWGVNANHALYHKDGIWYHHLEMFPGAFFDPNGYILFRTENEYRNCKYLDFGKHVHVPLGISSIPGYKKVRD